MKKVFITLLALAVMSMFLFLCNHYDNKTDKVVDYNSLRTELAQVERGDFFQFKSQWYVVENVNHNGCALFAHLNGSTNVVFQYDLSANIIQVGRIARWKDADHAIDHANWTAAAREFFLGGI